MLSEEDCSDEWCGMKDVLGQEARDLKSKTGVVEEGCLERSGGEKNKRKSRRGGLDIGSSVETRAAVLRISALRSS